MSIWSAMIIMMIKYICYDSYSARRQTGESKWRWTWRIIKNSSRPILHGYFFTSLAHDTHTHIYRLLLLLSSLHVPCHVHNNVNNKNIMRGKTGSENISIIRTHKQNYKSRCQKFHSHILHTGLCVCLESHSTRISSSAFTLCECVCVNQYNMN